MPETERTAHPLLPLIDLPLMAAVRTTSDHEDAEVDC